MLITIVTVAYNREKYLKQTTASVLRCNERYGYKLEGRLGFASLQILRGKNYPLQACEFALAQVTVRIVLTDLLRLRMPSH